MIWFLRAWPPVYSINLALQSQIEVTWKIVLKYWNMLPTNNPLFHLQCASSTPKISLASFSMDGESHQPKTDPPQFACWAAITVWRIVLDNFLQWFLTTAMFIFSNANDSLQMSRRIFNATESFFLCLAQFSLFHFSCRLPSFLLSSRMPQSYLDALQNSHVNMISASKPMPTQKVNLADLECTLGARTF
jgi:hypothetical protein